MCYGSGMVRVVLLLSLLAGPAFADGTGKKSFSELYPALPGVEYFCLDARGLRYELGQSICVTASCQTWMATCSMSLNNTTWRKISDGCPTASLVDRIKALG